MINIQLSYSVYVYITYMYIYGLCIKINVYTYTFISCIYIQIQSGDVVISKIKSYLIFPVHSAFKQWSIFVILMLWSVW